MALRSIDPVENRRRMEKGELYFAFTPDLIEDRRRCRQAFNEFNDARDITRRQQVELFQRIINDTTALPPLAPTTEEDEDQLADWVWCDAPVKMDYGYNVKFGKNCYVNSNSTWIDTSPITVGDRVVIGPNCSFFSGTHPTDPRVRNGTNGPETGSPITIGADCWFGGNCVVLPGVAIGRGCTIGAGSVVTRDIPPFMVACGNPARAIKPIRQVPAEELPPGYIPPADIPNSEAA